MQVRDSLSAGCPLHYTHYFLFIQVKKKKNLFITNKHINQTSD